MPLLQILTDPKNFKFYSGGKGYVSTSNSFGQKSIPYGKDTQGAGNSGQPYIQTPIPDSFNDLGSREDFILRGGINADKDSLTDIKRLGKMFIDTKSPNGLLFIAKQQLLSRTAVRTQTSGILNEGIYSPLNTLAEAGLVAFGGHLNKQGINPFAETGAYAKNDALYNSKVNKFKPLDENRLYQLTKAGVESEPIDFDGRKVILNDGLVNGVCDDFEYFIAVFPTPNIEPGPPV